MIDTLSFLRFCGFDVQIHESESMLKPPWTHLFVARHANDNFGEILILPIQHAQEDLDMVFGALLAQVPSMLELCGRYFNYLGGDHDEPYVETIRHAKESAIENQRFDDAASFRDTERKLQRGTY